MKQYLDLLSHVLETGSNRGDRTGTGTGTRSVFGYQMRFDLSKGFRSPRPRSCISSPSSTSFCGS